MSNHLLTIQFSTRPLWTGILLLLTLVYLSACQQEEAIVKLPPDDSAITISSPVTGLMMRVAKLDGSPDNILDNSSCLTVVLPVTVIVNGKTIVVNSPSDFGKVEDELDDDDDGEVAFVYPIQVLLPDYTRVTLTSKQQLEDLIQSCEDDDDFECIDFQYPLVFTVYDTNNQVSDVVTITNDEGLFNFIKQLRQGQLISLQFPVTVIRRADGSQVTITGYDELAAIILSSDDDCDDGDDDRFIDVLTAGGWRVDLFMQGSTNRTSDWTGYVFVFNPNGTLTATKESMVYTGTWTTDTDDGELELDIELMVGNPWDDINEDWNVVRYTSLMIEMTHSDDGVQSELIFKRI